MAMILPERTVDAWTAAYITGRRWRAQLWSPTEQKPGERYDLGVGLGNVGGVPVPTHSQPWPDKVFAFEHKGVDESSAGKPIIWLRVRQLLDHLEQDRVRGGNLVYFLLPDPEWRGRQPAPVGSVPLVAWRRTRGPKLPSTSRFAWDGFQLWAWVVHVEEVLRLVRSIFEAEPRRFRLGSGRGAAGVDWACAISMPDLASLQERVTLRDFISGVRECTHGRLVGSEVLGRRPPPAPALADRLGDSHDDLGEALGAAKGAERQADLDIRGEPPAADDDSAFDVFDRPAHTTFYGVGDSAQQRYD